MLQATFSIAAADLRVMLSHTPYIMGIHVVTAAGLPLCCVSRECASIVSMLPKASFPDRELSWLVSTAWNTGMHHARFDR
jgi:hypothetical protein